MSRIDQVSNYRLFFQMHKHYNYLQPILIRNYLQKILKMPSSEAWIWEILNLTTKEAEHRGPMSVIQMPVGQMFVGQMSVGQMSVGQIPVGQISVGQMSGLLVKCLLVICLLAKCSLDKCM